ncbi:MAG: hypothetical protein ACOCZK_00680 [Planctomycetota bacterium]
MGPDHQQASETDCTRREALRRWARMGIGVTMGAGLGALAWRSLRAGVCTGTVCAGCPEAQHCQLPPARAGRAQEKGGSDER